MLEMSEQLPICVGHPAKGKTWCITTVPSLKALTTLASCRSSRRVTMAEDDQPYPPPWLDKQCLPLGHSGAFAGALHRRGRPPPFGAQTRVDTMPTLCACLPRG